MAPMFETTDDQTPRGLRSMRGAEEDEEVEEEDEEEDEDAGGVVLDGVEEEGGLVGRQVGEGKGYEDDKSDATFVRLVEGDCVGVEGPEEGAREDPPAEER
jgi:uncharacterized protein YcfJ